MTFFGHSMHVCAGFCWGAGLVKMITVRVCCWRIQIFEFRAARLFENVLFLMGRFQTIVCTYYYSLQLHRYCPRYIRCNNYSGPVWMDSANVRKCSVTLLKTRPFGLQRGVLLLKKANKHKITRAACTLCNAQQPEQYEFCVRSLKWTELTQQWIGRNMHDPCSSQCNRIPAENGDKRSKCST